MPDLSPTIDGLPLLCGHEDAVRDAANNADNVFLGESRIDFGSIRSAFAIALHMQQPLIPAGGDDLQTADLISNLQFMMEHQDQGDNHNAPVFRECYKRIAGLTGELAGGGNEPRVMLDYSGCLLYGLIKMGAGDVVDALRGVTQDPHLRRCVEWLGCTWSHAVAPSTPVQDFRLHVTACQHDFAAHFGFDALKRVRGFSPAEMALPNHPDVAHAFVKTLRDCGFTWVLVQEHTVENPENGHGPERPHLPHRLVVKNSDGEEASILVLVKTQGSDTKLVAQMQPFYEAKSLEPLEIAGHRVPPLVSQIGDGENGGVMMNEFPDMFRNAMGESSGSDTPAMNGTEYLEHLFASGVKEADLPVLQPSFQHRIWERFNPGDGAAALEKTIEALKQEDDRFHMEGGSWTNNISWVEGYEDVMGPIEEVSALFHEKVIQPGVSATEPRYRKALYYLLVSQTSCYRYWGEGAWTDYAKEICRRAKAILENDF